MTPKITCTRILGFDAAHRLMNHEGKCATMHGHRYTVEVTAQAVKGMDDLGRIVDFSILKEKIGGWIDEHWDHNVIVYKNDTETLKLINEMPQRKSPFISHWNPTAENMAHYLLTTVCHEQLLGLPVHVIKIRLYETPNCYVEATL